MKFCIATVTYWESLGYNTLHWRKSIDKIKAIVHLEYGEILANNLENDENVIIYDNIDPVFQSLLESEEWKVNGEKKEIIDTSLAKRIIDLESAFGELVGD